ncbi:hypothetical protein PVAND_001797 [Polypedilum vanderplanki]|uniref:Uncharacterized protein n=1 Tax=Polypedilum vanderplanki TaxID=319348 RepID=A0A9J6BP26_POLVA|nr:hypothetical protein PVAND_001797 [Polypedilum vanderplanki]
MNQVKNITPKFNEPSVNLSNEENELVFSLIGNHCQTQCTTIAQLFQTEPPFYRKWMKKHTGVLCFVKDNAKRSYYLRMYCLINYQMVYEQEIYDNIEICREKPYLITFEGQDGMIALNFAFEREAESFYKILTSTVERRNQRKMDRIIQKTSTSINNSPQLSTLSKKNRKKKKLSKDDIGTPSNFKHVTHFGQNANSGFDLTGNYELYKPFLNKAGVSKKHLKDPETRKIIKDFLDENKVEMIVNNEEPPPLPKRPPTLGKSRPLPELPRPPMIAPQMKVPTNAPIHSTLPKTIDNFSAPPPPPPPPILDMLPPTSLELPKQSQQKSIPIALDPREELLRAIRNGTALKTVDKEMNPKEKCEVSSETKTNELADILIQRLKEREEVFRPSSDEDEEDEDVSDDEEWDD